MKKNVWYIVVLIVLAVAVYFLVFKSKLTTLNNKDNVFDVADTASVSKIFLTDMTGKSLTLQRSGSRWMLNNKYLVRADLMQILLSTIKDIRVKYPVAESGHNNVLKDLSTTAIKIEIYDKNNKLIRSYYVGGSDALQTGTFMIMPGSDKPYATYIPGFNGFLTTRYSTDTIDWRDRNIFNFEIPQISSVIVNYTDNRKDSSFEVDVVRPDSFQLKVLNGKTINKPAVKEKLFLYLLAFKQLNAEGYKNNEPIKDSLLHTIPFCTLTVVDRNGKPHVAKCYHKKVTVETMQQFDEHGQPVPFDMDHYYASINDDRDFVLIQQFHFARVLKTYSYFFTPLVAPLKR